RAAKELEERVQDMFLDVTKIRHPRRNVVSSKVRLRRLTPAPTGNPAVVRRWFSEAQEIVGADVISRRRLRLDRCAGNEEGVVRPPLEFSINCLDNHFRLPKKTHSVLQGILRGVGQCYNELSVMDKGFVVIDISTF